MSLVAIQPDQSTIHFNWEILYLCNYHCSYCYLNSKLRQNHRYLELSGLKVIVDGLYSVVSKLSMDTSLCYIGGEPTLHPALPNILEYSFDKLPTTKHTITTNGSRSVDYFMEIASIVKSYNAENRFMVYLTYHYEKSNLIDLIGKSKILQSKGIRAVIKLMINPASFDNFRKDNDLLLEQGVEFIYKLLVNTEYAQCFIDHIKVHNTDDFVTDFLFEVFARDGNDIQSYRLKRNEVMSSHLDEYQGFMCYPGRFMNIAPNGMVNTICDHYFTHTKTPILVFPGNADRIVKMINNKSRCTLNVSCPYCMSPKYLDGFEYLLR